MADHSQAATWLPSEMSSAEPPMKLKKRHHTSPCAGRLLGERQGEFLSFEAKGGGREQRLPAPAAAACLEPQSAHCCALPLF